MKAFCKKEQNTYSLLYSLLLSNVSALLVTHALYIPHTGNLCSSSRSLSRFCFETTTQDLSKQNQESKFAKPSILH